MGFGFTPVNSDGSLGNPVITNTLLQGGIVSIYYLGTLIGALFGGWVGDRIGRTRAIALGAAWGVLGASLQCSAQNHSWMICGMLYMTSTADSIFGIFVSSRIIKEPILIVSSTTHQRLWYWHFERCCTSLGNGDF
jgi:MFS family permease